MKHYPHHIGDFDKATRHLTRIERSVYRDLIDLYYDTEQMLPLDIAALCRKIIARSNEESTAVEQVLNEFFTKTPTGWYHDRCETEIALYRTNTSQKALAGRASAEAKRLKKEQAKNGEATAVEQPLTPVATDGNGTPTNQEPRTKNQEPIVGTRKRATQIPADFQPNDTGLKYAEQRRVNTATELQSFRNHHTAKGTVLKDWQAGWRTWCDKAVEFGRAGSPGKAAPAETFRERDERLARAKWAEITGKPQPEERRTIDVTPHIDSPFLEFQK